MDQFFRFSIREELFLNKVESSLDIGELSTDGGLLPVDMLVGADRGKLELLEDDGNVFVFSFGGVSFNIS